MNSVAIILALVSLAAILSLAYGAVSLEIVSPAPGDPNKCSASGDRPALAVGKSKAMSGCTEVRCSKRDSGELIVQTVSCGVLSAPEECQKVEDLSKPYPDCCPQVKCP